MSLIMSFSDSQFKSIELNRSDFDRHLPAFDENLESNFKLSLKAYYHQCQERLIELMQEGMHPSLLLGIRSRMIDDVISRAFNYYESQVIKKIRYHGPRMTVLAQGGYGREEMNLYSDIDILFLHPQRKGEYFETVSESILYFLWDCACDVGHASRNIRDCREIFHEDVTAMTALLDMRYICGDSDLFEELQNEVQSWLDSESIQKKFFQAKTQERENRIKKYGDSVFVLEPNVKENAGSLRDIQLASWLAKIQKKKSSFEDLAKLKLLTHDEVSQLRMAQNFFWKIRNEIHLIVKRKIDVLSFDRQIQIASKLGFEDDENGILAVEKFMQLYYNLAYDVFNITNRLLRKMRGEQSLFFKLKQKIGSKKIDESFRVLDNRISIRNPETLHKKPVKIMRAFEHVQKLGLPLDAETKDHIRAIVSSLHDDYCSDPKAVEIFRSIVSTYKNLGLVFFEMHDSYFLETWMPEFKPLRSRVQHDIYHTYTVDTHSVFALKEIELLAKGDYDDQFDFYREVLEQIEKPEMLNLGLLLHDVGKGRGGNHSVKGAVLAEDITQRFNYNDKEKFLIDFLIRSHLMMPHLSQRRDLDDPELITKFARSMESVDQLNMLFILTWADIRAVGPQAWTEWKGVLLRKLYDRAKEVLTKGDLSQEKISKKKDSLRKLLRQDTNLQEDDLEEFLGIMPDRYFFGLNIEEILTHFKLYQKTLKEKIVLDYERLEDLNMYDLSFWTLNTPRVFSQVTGVMLYYSINIVRADIYQTSNGYVLVHLRVYIASSLAADSQGLFERLQSTIEEVLLGRQSVKALLEGKELPDYLKKKNYNKKKSVIKIDNDISAYNTVIDIYTNDRLGLLYDITKLLNDQACFIEVSKISTKVDQVADIFYVKDIFGHKITSPDKKKKLKDSLTELLEGES